MRHKLCFIRRMQQDDLVAAAKIHKNAFARQRNSFHWLACNLVAYPRIISYVIICEDQCIGYCIWTQKSGFRPEVVIELEQIAVTPAFRGRGIAAQLLTESLEDVRGVLAMHRSVLKHIVITTGAAISAQRLYASVLGAKVEARLSDIYSDEDDVIMVARDLLHLGQQYPISLHGKFAPVQIHHPT